MRITEDDVRQLAYGEHDDYEFVSEVAGEDRRWSRTMTTIFRHDGKLYSVEWEQALTEMQENDYDEQDAVEVEEKTRTIVTTYYVPVKGK